MAKVLVTGGAGFIGVNLVAKLLKEGHEVVVLDNFYTGRKEKLASLGVTLIPRDGREASAGDGFDAGRKEKLGGLEVVLLEQDVREAIAGEYDWIFHLACPASPPHYQQDALFTLETAFDGTRQVLECARRCGARVVIASTSEVYGDPLLHPQQENYWGNVNPIGARSCYDEGKRAAETLALLYKQARGVDVRLARIFNTYGPHMEPDDGRVISNFVLQALRNEPLTLYGDGSQTRSCQYIDDLLRAFLLYIEKPVEELDAFFSERGVPVPVLNLGNPRETTVREIAEGVLALLPESRSELICKPLPADDPKRRRPDISWARACLGWEPEVALEAGLQRTIDHFRSLA